MRKKFSILKTIDLDKLCCEIDNYIIQTGKTDPYIFMSTATSEATNKEVESTYAIPNYLPKGYVAKFEGYNVFFNDELAFGEVEIR